MIRETLRDNSQIRTSNVHRCPIHFTLDCGRRKYFFGWFFWPGINIHIYIQTIFLKRPSLHSREWREWIMKKFFKNSPIIQCRISALHSIQHNQEYSLEWIQTPTSLFHLDCRAHIWTILRIGHWDRDCILWLCSHYREVHLCIERSAESTLRSHTRPELGSLLLFIQRSCDIISDLNDVPIVSIS